MANNVTDLGKVGITLKGEWNSSASYERLDTVTYEGSLYIAIRDNSGSQPSESNTNWMLGAKHGEFTEQQLEDFKAEVVAESKEEMDDYTDDKKTELDTYTGTKKTELDTYEGTKEAELNTYASGLKDDFDSNATSKTNAFNTNATSKTTAFNNNATAKTTAFDTNATTKTSAFDDNATAKTTAFDENAEEKTGDFNDNVDTKTAEFDAHVVEKEAEFDENVDSIQEQITDIQEFIDSELEQGITEKATRADTSNSAKWYGKLTPTGRTYQKQLQGYNFFDYTQFKNLAFGTKQDASGNYILQNKNYRGYYMQVDPNVTYIISRKSTTDFSRFRVCCTEVLPAANVPVISGSIVNGDGLTDLSITIPQNGQYLFLYLSNNAEDITTEAEVQITKSEELLPYEPYVGGQASPSPDYPQEIRNVEGRSCRNLFHKDTITTGYRIVWATGEPYAEPTAEISDFIEINGDTDYILTNRCYIIAYDDAKQYLGALTNTGIAKSNGITTTNFKLSNDVKYVKLLKYGEANNFIGFQMNEGKTLLPYEPYFEGKRLEFNVYNKNLIYGEIESGYFDSTTGQKIANSSYYRNANPIKVHPNTDYIFSINGAGSGINVFAYAKDMSFIGRVGSSSILSNSYFTTPANAAYINVFKSTGVGNEKWQVEKGQTISSFVEHQEQIIPFPLQEGQKLMEGDYLADDGVHHVMNIVDMSTLSYSFISSNDTFQTTISDIKRQTAGTKFKGKATSYSATTCATNTKWAEKSNGTVGLRSGSTIEDSTHTVCFKDNRFVSATDFKNAMANNYLLYELEQEIVDTYTEEQAEAYNKLKKIMLNQGVNHIWTETDGLEPNLQLTYYKSNKQRLNNIEARLELLEE